MSDSKPTTIAPEAKPGASLNFTAAIMEGSGPFIGAAIRGDIHVSARPLLHKRILNIESIKNRVFRKTKVSFHFWEVWANFARIYQTCKTWNSDKNFTTPTRWTPNEIEICNNGISASRCIFLNWIELTHKTQKLRQVIAKHIAMGAHPDHEKDKVSSCQG